MSRYLAALVPTLVFAAVCGCRSNECGSQAPRCGSFNSLPAPSVPGLTPAAGFRGTEAMPVSDRSAPPREARLLGR